MTFRAFIPLLLFALLSACAARQVSLPPGSNNPAVLALLGSADAKAGAGQISAAAADLERALRIEPRNPVLWHELAHLHLQEGDYRQAESLAARSNSWAGVNRALLALNWRIIAEARSNLGDDSGAQAALARARELGE